FDVGIFLDINESGNSFSHFSATVFDPFESYYHTEPDSLTDCFMNICFDIYEIERGKLERVLANFTFNKSQIDSLYQQTEKKAEAETQRYFKEVQHGKNFTILKKWNKYVLENLGIDNMKWFGLNEFSRNQGKD